MRAMNIAATGMHVQQNTIDVIANNLANMNTSGFKSEKMLFAEHLVRARGGESVQGDTLHFVRDIATVRDMSEGPLISTGNPLDIAVRGKSMIAIQTTEGERYTRNGSMMISADGELVAGVARRTGWYPVRGSSSSGGREALTEMIELQ